MLANLLSRKKKAAILTERRRKLIRPALLAV
jgi:hypothetical protein